MGVVVNKKIGPKFIKFLNSLEKKNAEVRLDLPNKPTIVRDLALYYQALFEFQIAKHDINKSIVLF